MASKRSRKVASKAAETGRAMGTAPGSNMAAKKKKTAQVAVREVADDAVVAVVAAGVATPGVATAGVVTADEVEVTAVVAAAERSKKGGDTSESLWTGG
jgi:hypothetical protein